MKKYLLTLSLFIGIANGASEGEALKNNFLQSVSKDKQEGYNKFFSTPWYKEAATYFTDKSKMYEATKSTGDPHTKEFNNAQTIKIPNWVEIYKIYYDSPIKENNPVSAFYALFIMRSYLGATRDGDKLAQRHKLAEILYKAKICQGFLEWGGKKNQVVYLKTQKTQWFFLKPKKANTKQNKAKQSKSITALLTERIAHPPRKPQNPLGNMAGLSLPTTNTTGS